MRMSRNSRWMRPLVGGAILLMLMLPLALLAANQLQNDGLEPPFNAYGTWTGSGHVFTLEVAHDWEKFYIPSGTYDSGNKLRYFRASAVEFLYGFTEKRDGADAQLFWSTKPYDAGIYQQVSGLTPGENYGLQIGILQVYANTTSKTDNKMFRSVGIDPTGGTDPSSSNVIWGPEEGKDVDWFYPGVGAEAISSTMTVFVRVRSTDDAPTFEENLVWVDDAFLDIAPTTTLTLTLDSATQVTANWSGTPRSGFNLFAYEAQYRKDTETTWTDLQVFTSDEGANPPSTGTSQSFTVEPWVEYLVRARTWHEQSGGDSHEIPGPWTEGSFTSGGMVTGNVLDNRGNSMNGATVSVSGHATSTTTTNDGSYTLFTGAGSFEIEASLGSGWSIPNPVGVTVPDISAIVPLTITLRPAEDAISNGDFTAGLTGWDDSGTTPTTSSAEYRTAGRSLKLTGDVSISQTSAISGGYEPILSFWYKLSGGDGDDVFTAQILGDETVLLSAAGMLSFTNTFSTSTIGNWQHHWLSLNLTEVYTGEVGVKFTLSQSGLTQTTVYLDEVSLGKAGGGPNKTYLPIVLKGT